MSISIHFASASCSRILGVQLAAIESSVVNVLHTWLLDGDFKLFLMPAKVSLDRVCLFCTSVTKSCTALQSTPSPRPSLSDPYVDTSLCLAIALSVGRRRFAHLSGAKGDTAQAGNFCQALREIAMLMLARNNYSLPDGKCVDRTSVRCKAEATGAKLSEDRSTQLQSFQMNGEPDWRSSLALLRAVYQIGSQACRTRRVGTSCIIRCGKVQRRKKA